MRSSKQSPIKAHHLARLRELRAELAREVREVREVRVPKKGEQGVLDWGSYAQSVTPLRERS